MAYDSEKHSGRLRRLPASCYEGIRWIHWTMTVENRKTGWLDPLHHARLREGLCHALARERLICAAYCLMPDHGHFLLGGLSASSRQKAAIKGFRTRWNELLSEVGFRLDLQPYDHVLTRDEQDRGKFETVRAYILENPRRAGLAAQLADWPYLGAMAAGYPSLDPRDEDFHDHFWKIYDRLLESLA